GLSRDWRFTILAGILLLAYGVILATPPLRDFFELYPLEPQSYLHIAIAALVWALVLRLAWRRALLDEFFGITISPLRSPTLQQTD
ncbi:MAG: hypothetical protein AAFW95_15180, partial [Cyanobacteria bacterium J06638_6]